MEGHRHRPGIQTCWASGHRIAGTLRHRMHHVYLPHMARNMFVDLADKSPIRRGTARGHAHASLFVELLGKQLAGSEKIPADAGV